MLQKFRPSYPLNPNPNPSQMEWSRPPGSEFFTTLFWSGQEIFHHSATGRLILENVDVARRKRDSMFVHTHVTFSLIIS